jgi:hypothetical protein
MLDRCYNPRHASYALYGGRGIKVCRAWRRSFPAFLAVVGRRPSPRHQLDRIKNAQGYKPGNVKWSTAREQARNRRTTRLLTFHGEKRTAGEWAAIVGLERRTILARIDCQGMTVKQALTTPVLVWRRRKR